MNLGIRAFLYTARKWKKTLLLFCLLLSITTLVLSGLAIADAQEKQTEDMRGTTGASFTVERNLSTGGWTSGAHGSYSTQEFISDEMLQEIAAVDGISGYDASIVSMPYYFKETGDSVVTTGYTNSFYTYGYVNTEYNDLFASGRFELVEGSHITEDMTNGLIISRERAEQNGLEVGSKVVGINDPYTDDPEVDMEIVGIFEVVADKNDEATMYDASTMWDFSEYAFCSKAAMEAMCVNYGDGNKIQEADFFVTDAAQLESVINEVQSISSINWDHFIVTANDEVYQNISSALSDTTTLVTTLIVMITVVSMVLIILILSMSIRSRKREIGILLAVGIEKYAVLLQQMLEICLVAIVAFPLAYLASREMAGNIGTLFGKAAENVIVTPQHFVLVGACGAGLLIIAVLVSCIPVMRMKPKAILLQME
ncbi:ABC transporter permease [Blautia sp. An46]|uniref:ABC transporter permease n=1 Tax=Blautia sp. An46 TaxID=1965636 RepID=UPI000B381DE2|nr:ABC transporter permease [Blautia sp. An46]OUN91909.1 ABC transporter permease [Blautia sp. An46]OUP00806.1 ABC transporter permease [Drancourtella sp. An210]